MLPTETQVIDYVTRHPWCMSKEIARHFGCTTDIINRAREGYRGIYKIPNLVRDGFKHAVSDTKPATAPTNEIAPTVQSVPLDQHNMLVDSLKEQIKFLEDKIRDRENRIAILEDDCIYPLTTTTIPLDLLIKPQTTEFGTQTEPEIPETAEIAVIHESPANPVILKPKRLNVRLKPKLIKPSQ